MEDREEEGKEGRRMGRRRMGRSSSKQLTEVPGELAKFSRVGFPATQSLPTRLYSIGSVLAILEAKLPKCKSLRDTFKQYPNHSTHIFTCFLPSKILLIMPPFIDKQLFRFGD